MLKRSAYVGLLFVLAATTACYHATIETGATPSTTEIRKGFASSWIYGLVPPSTVATASQCSNGVARVETRLSFVNQLVRFLTIGIYTPMEIVVTCAAAGAASADQPAANDVVEFDAAAPGSMEEALTTAIARSRDEGRAIYLRAN